MKQLIAALLVVDIIINILNRRSLLFIHKKQKKIMTEAEKFSAQLDRIDVSTNNIAGELRDLRTQIAGQGLPADQEQSVLARLTAAADKLEGIGKTTDSTSGSATGAQGDTGSTPGASSTGADQASGSGTGTDQETGGATGGGTSQATDQGAGTGQ